MRFVSAILLIVLSITNFNASGKTSFVMNENCINAYKNIIDLQFERANLLLTSEKTKNPTNLIPYYLDNYTDFLKLFIGESLIDYKEFQKNKSKRLKYMESGDPSSPYCLYTQAEILLQWAFIHLKFQDYILGAKDINKAYSLLEKNQKIFPNFILNKKGLGVLHALIGTIPEKYMWLANIAGFEGSVKQGILEISDVFLNAYKQPKYSYLLTESIFYLNFLTITLSNNQTELNALYKWQNKIDTLKSPLFIFSKVSLLKKRGENDKIINTLQTIKTTNQYPFHYLTYMLGESKLYKLDYSAIIHLEEYVKNFKGQNFIKAAWLRIAWAHLLNGNIEKYRIAKANIIKYGISFVEDDKYAQNEAKKAEMPNIPLLKARLLFDGGYYSKSLSLLLEKEPSQYAVTPKDISEFYYRLARNYHMLNQLENALKFYQITVETSKNIQEYFIPNAALQMGLIYENKGEIIKAREYFNKCLKMKDCDFKSGIDQKAKAGLERLN